MTFDEWFAAFDPAGRQPHAWQRELRWRRRRTCGVSAIDATGSEDGSGVRPGDISRGCSLAGAPPMTRPREEWAGWGRMHGPGQLHPGALMRGQVPMIKAVAALPTLVVSTVHATARAHRFPASGIRSQRRVKRADLDGRINAHLDGGDEARDDG